MILTVILELKKLGVLDVNIRKIDEKIGENGLKYAQKCALQTVKVAVQ